MKIKIITMLAVVLTGLFLTSCDDKIEVQQAYNFWLTTMPVQKRIKQGETAEIRLHLHKSGNYRETEFFISYFQPDGRGSLRMDDGTVFAPNDFYPLKKETFRLYYTSETTDQQQIDVYVYDSFGQRFDLNFSFQNDSDKENEGASS